MFNYKIRQNKIDFFKITNPYPALKQEIIYVVSVGKSELMYILSKNTRNWSFNKPS